MAESWGKATIELRKKAKIINECAFFTKERILKLKKDTPVQCTAI